MENLMKKLLKFNTKIKDSEGKEQNITVDKDDGIRETTKEGLEKLKPAFSKEGTTTAGNSSQVSDGAAGMLIMTRNKAKELGLKIIGTFRGYATKGCDPSIMGIGPAVAIPEVLKQTKLSIEDIDLFEINEAFASQFGYCIEKLKIPYDKTNVNGGAIALGHPLGCTGARLVSTLLYELRRRKKKLGIISMCIGTGMGAAGVFEAEL